MGRVKGARDKRGGTKRIQLDGVESTVESMETFIVESDRRRRGRLMKAVSGEMSVPKKTAPSVGTQEEG